MESWVIMESEPPYSNREIREHWHGINGKLQEILLQTKLTNGRVNSLEKYRYTLVGAVAVLSAIALPLMIWMLLTLVNVNNKVSAYELHQPSLAPDL